MKKRLQDTGIDVKVKLSVLWICLMFFYLYNDVLSFYRKDIVEGVLSGDFGAIQVTPDFLLAGAILMAIPVFMVFLSLALPAKFNRWTNIIVGVFHIAVPFSRRSCLARPGPITPCTCFSRACSFS